jgi:hypothetical protein
MIFDLFSDKDLWELLSYIVTVFGFPFVIYVFLMEQRKERINEQEEIFVQLLDDYTELSKILIKNADLKLLSGKAEFTLSEEQQEKKLIIFDLLISFFERAYILIYEEKMDKQSARMWRTWEDYIDFWLNRNDFRESLSELLSGEDEEFVGYITNKLKYIKTKEKTSNY